jgi:hypothetical protein
VPGGGAIQSVTNDIVKCPPFCGNTTEFPKFGGELSSYEVHKPFNWFWFVSPSQLSTSTSACSCGVGVGVNAPGVGTALAITMAAGIEDNGIVGFFFAHAVNIKAVIASERITAVTFFIF